MHLDSHKDHQPFTAKLFQYQGKKLEQLSIASQAEYDAIHAKLSDAKLPPKVVRVEKKAKQRYAAAPFTTSTLQQEAVRKLGMTADRTMRTAQSLYEGVDIGGQTVGLISYMRTDSVSLAKEAVQEIRDYIRDNFSAEYLPATQPAFKSKTKNAQESHEAIRPTSIVRTPDSMRDHLTADQARLYEMIWKRTLACQMAPARFDTVSVDIRLGGDNTLFRANGQVLVFPGFIGVYMEDVDDATEEEGGKLPPLAEGDVLPIDKLYGEQHFTQPPPRYSEASLVKSLEEHGIGRPSTYATIISTLQAREYAILDKKRFMPTDVGRVVTRFLTDHFTRYVDYGFTAHLEDELDEVSEGKRDWIGVMDEFWKGFSKLIKEKADIDRPVGIDRRGLSEMRQAARQKAQPLRQLHQLHQLSRSANTSAASAANRRTMPRPEWNWARIRTPGSPCCCCAARMAITCNWAKRSRKKRSSPSASPGPRKCRWNRPIWPAR